MSDHQQPENRGSDVGGEQGNVEERDDDELSIIDVSEFDDTRPDRWLYSSGNNAEDKFENLYDWLHADIPQLEAAGCDNSRKSIDTRTFTRIKRRSNNKLNFDSAEASTSSGLMRFSLSNVWKNQTIPELPGHVQSIHKDKKENVPLMLRPKTNQVLAALLSESPSSINSQTSMEAFMNMSKEEINPLNNDKNDPDVSHFLMNISQPSLLYSSIISDGRGDESNQPSALDSLIDSQILSDSMMESSMFKEVQDTTILTKFLKQDDDNTLIEDNTFCLQTSDANDKTIILDSNLDDKTFEKSMDKPNETFLTDANVKANSTYLKLSPLKSDITSNSIKSVPQKGLLNTTQVIDTASSLNSTIIITSKKDTIEIANIENKTDLTFDKSTASTPIVNLVHKGSNVNCRNSLDTTYDTVPNLRLELLQEVQRSSANKFDETFSSTELPSIENKLNITYKNSNESPKCEVLNSTYVQNDPLDKLESESNKETLDATYDAKQIGSKLNNLHGMRHLSYAKKNQTESQMNSVDQNRFNTFKKDNKISNRLPVTAQVYDSSANKSEVNEPSVNDASNTKNNDNLYQQRFNTFSKKMCSKKINTYIENNQDENKLNSTFTKPFEKLPRQIQAPRQLSKLPQLFQKSNPNLRSKPLGKLTLESEAGFRKGSQSNIAGNKQTLGRFKSEQRLLQMKSNTDFSMSDGTSRSMESIESTASAHSAPDLDDRLSMCSDSSRASYVIKPRSVQILQNMSEEGIKFDGFTPKLKGHQVLENTWVEEKDLPSPIKKNGTLKNYAESIGSRSSSASDSAEFNAKTSSPITMSPTNSDQAVLTMENNDAGNEATKENIKVTENIRPKELKMSSSGSTATNATKLRRPTNWTGTQNKNVNCTASGIPRPASRIPAPKFAKPNLK